MKASLAMALSHHAELIIMDEPTAGLDPVFRREFLSLLHELVQDGEKTIFFSTHITSDLDRIAVILYFYIMASCSLQMNYWQLRRNLF